MNGRMKKIMTLALTGILTVALTTSGVYANPKKKLLEAFDDIQIEYNGTTLSDVDGPLLINNKTYIPLRMLMTYFGDKEIAWDNDNRKVKVKNKLNSTDSMYMSQISTRNTQITALEKEVKDLKAQLAAAKAEATKDDLDISKLKKALNDDYEDYDRKDISISLSGDTSKIKLTVTLDKSDWNDFSASKKVSFLEKICDDIWDEAEKATIEGTVKDGNKALDSFTVKPGKDVSLEDEDEDEDPDFGSLETAIVKKFKTDWSDEKLVLSLDISGTATKITYKANVDMSKYDDEWDDLSASKKKRLMDSIYDEIKDDYSKATITGYAYDTKNKKNLAKYDGSNLTEY